MDCERSDADQIVYHLRPESNFIFILVDVDNIVIFSNLMSAIEKTDDNFDKHLR